MRLIHKWDLIYSSQHTSSNLISNYENSKHSCEVRLSSHILSEVYWERLGFPSPRKPTTFQRIPAPAPPRDFLRWSCDQSSSNMASLGVTWSVQSKSCDLISSAMRRVISLKYLGQYSTGVVKALLPLWMWPPYLWATYYLYCLVHFIPEKRLILSVPCCTKPYTGLCNFFIKITMS